MALDAGALFGAGPAIFEADGRDFTRESFHAEHLPFLGLAAPDVLLLREGDLMATLRLDGMNPMTTPDVMLDALKRAVAAIVTQTGAAFGFYVHRISIPQADLALRPVEGDGFAAAIDGAWQNHVARQPLQRRQLYLTILRRPALGARMPLFRRLACRAWTRDRAIRLQELGDVVGFFQAALASARPVRLTSEGGDWLGFLNTLLSGRFEPIGFGRSLLPVATALGSVRTTFEGDTIVVSDAITGETRYGAVFSIKTYPAMTDVTLLDRLDLPLDMVVTNSFTPIAPNLMAERIQRIIRQMRASDDAAVSLRDELMEAADDQEAGRVAFGNHHLSIAVYAPDRDVLDRAGAEIRRAGQEMTAVIVRERMAAKAIYFAQAPGNYGYRARKAPISSTNFADFAALHGSTIGRPASKSPWGETVTILPTTGAAGYRFNFHEPGSPDDEPTVGHTLIIGRTGSGKSVLAAFLAAQAQRAGARLFFFDKDRGLEMAIRALGGRYRLIQAGVPTGLDPLRTETDARGQAWLIDWFTALVSRAHELSGDQARQVQRAVEQNAAADPQLRSFDNFTTLFRSLDDGGDLHARVAEWAPGGRFGWLFNGTASVIDVSGDVLGFDMTEILDMGVERMAVLSYIFRLIERQVEDRRPTVIVLDEAWKLLDDAYFVSRLENWLVTLRKMNVVVIMMTQFPGQLASIRVGRTIVETAPTQVLFPNDRARPEDYEVLRVERKEAELLVQPNVGRRTALVRSAGDSVFVNVDLSALGSFLAVLGGGRAGAARVGANWINKPDFWRP